MTREIDLQSWDRRSAFQFFRHYDNPYFNVCLNLDVTALLQLCRANQGPPFSLASLFLALRTANECEPFRYRLADGRVLVHDRVHAGTTHLVQGQRLAFIYFDYAERFADFRAGAEAARQRAEAEQPAIDGRKERSDLIHFSSLPWISFTSVTHARNWGTEESVPKITFGKYFEEGDRVRMPISVEVHHALMDGVHVGEFVQRLEQLCAAPETWLG